MWNPAEKPYRVTQVRPTGAWGLHGWRSSHQTYATLQEAEAAYDAAAAKDVRLDRADNAAEWLERGRWTQLKRKRAK